MKFVGIDPSLRHTGLCLREGAEFLFDEIKTEGEDVLTASKTIRARFRDFIKKNNAQDAVFCQEKQLSVGGQSSSLMFHCQMNMLEVIKEQGQNPKLVMPLPIQLQSYVKKRHGAPAADGRPYVEHFKRTMYRPQRISIHCVDAYYLTRLGEDVIEGTWRYPLPSNEQALIPWGILNGDQR
jgi:hypothetical protein